MWRKSGEGRRVERRGIINLLPQKRRELIRGRGLFWEGDLKEDLRYANLLEQKQKSSAPFQDWFGTPTWPRWLLVKTLCRRRAPDSQHHHRGSTTKIPRRYSRIRQTANVWFKLKFSQNREVAPWGTSPFSIIYQFWQKGTPFIFLLLTNSTPFTHPVLTAANALSLSMNKSQYQNIFSTFIQPKNASVSHFGPFYYRPKWRISLTFHIPQLVKSQPFHILEALSGGASPKVL